MQMQESDETVVSIHGSGSAEAGWSVHGRFKIVEGPCRPCQAASRGVKATQVRPESVVRYMAGGDDAFASAPGAQANPVRALMKSKLVPSWVKERPCGTAVQVRPPFAVV